MLFLESLYVIFYYYHSYRHAKKKEMKFDNINDSNQTKRIIIVIFH